MFKPATRQQIKLRLALVGPSGSGKTYTALRIARGLAGTDGRIAVIDSERGSASLYAGEVTNYDACELTKFQPGDYVTAIRAADDAGYDVLIIDSLSHAWAAALEMVDAAAKRSRSGNSFTAWRDVTPKHNAMVDAILTSKAHVIVTMRAKTAHSQEKNDKGRTVIRKVGMEAIQRAGMEYEFTVVGDLDLEHNLAISKTRCTAIDGRVIHKAGEELGQELLNWLGQGEPPMTPEQWAETVKTPEGVGAGRVMGLMDEIRPSWRTYSAAQLGDARRWLEMDEGAARLVAAGGAK